MVDIRREVSRGTSGRNTIHLITSQNLFDSSRHFAVFVWREVLEKMKLNKTGKAEH